MRYAYEKVENNNKTVSLDVYFEKPSAISKDILEADILEIKLKETELFVSTYTKEKLLE